MSKTEIIVMCSIVGLLLVGIIISLIVENTTVKVEERMESITIEDRMDTMANLLTSDEMEDSVIGGCVEEGGNIEYCQCFYDYLDARTSNAEMIEIGFKVLNDELPDIMMDGVAECIYLFEY